MQGQVSSPCSQSLDPPCLGLCKYIHQLQTSPGKESFPAGISFFGQQHMIQAYSSTYSTCKLFETTVQTSACTASAQSTTKRQSVVRPGGWSAGPPSINSFGGGPLRLTWHRTRITLNTPDPAIKYSLEYHLFQVFCLESTYY